jgi:hypothetical protein
VEVVEHGHDRPTIPAIEVGEQVHHVELVSDVEVDRRLVEEDDRGRLGDRHREEHQLPLAKRQLADVAAHEAAQPDALDRAGDGRSIGRSEASQPVLVREPAERHDGLDRCREREARRLRDDCDPSGDLFSIHSREVPALHEDLAARRSEQPGDEAEERRLAGSVWADDRDELSGADLQVDVVEHRPRAVPGRHAAQGEDRFGHSS